MRVGAHISTAGGVGEAFSRARDVGCETMLIFTKSNRQWRAKPLSQEEIVYYQQQEEAHGEIDPVSVHASYLINIASPKEELWEKSFQALKVELLRADALGIATLNFHPGSHVGSGEEAGLAAISKGLTRLLEETPDCQTIVCLETMAGQGTNLGYSFEQLATLLDAVGRTDRIGVCLDTCHVFAAGYDIRSAETYAETMARFDATVGYDYLRCFHFNDSRFELGARKDRHAHIGQGHIGLSGFANFMNDARWADHAAHIETPKIEEDDDGNEVEMDPINLTALKSLRQDQSA